MCSISRRIWSRSGMGHRELWGGQIVYKTRTKLKPLGFVYHRMEHPSRPAEALFRKHPPTRWLGPAPSFPNRHGLKQAPDLGPWPSGPSDI